MCLKVIDKKKMNDCSNGVPYFQTLSTRNMNRNKTFPCVLLGSFMDPAKSMVGPVVLSLASTFGVADTVYTGYLNR